MLRSLKTFSEGQQSWERGLKSMFCEDTRVVQSGRKDVERQTHCSLQLPEEGKRRGRSWALLLETHVRMHRNNTKSCHRRFRMDIRKKLFIMWMVKLRDRIPRKVADAPYLSVLKYICIKPSIMYFNFLLPLKWSGIWTRGSLKTPSK